MNAICRILAPFPVHDSTGKQITALQAGQTWCGILNRNDEFVFWAADAGGILRKAKIQANDQRIKITTICQCQHYQRANGQCGQVSESRSRE